MKPNIEISEAHLQEVANLLNTLLADEYVIYTKTRNAHWNIQGPNFMELHRFFQTQYEQLDEVIDELAERVRAIGHFAVGSLQGFLKSTHLLEDAIDFKNQKTVIEALIADHETIIRLLRNDITPIAEKYKDVGSADFLTGLLKAHEKMSWMLRAYVS